MRRPRGVPALAGDGLRPAGSTFVSQQARRARHDLLDGRRLVEIEALDNAEACTQRRRHQRQARRLRR